MPTARTRVYLSLTDIELAKLDKERGTVPRATWLKDCWSRRRHAQANWGRGDKPGPSSDPWEMP